MTGTISEREALTPAARAAGLRHNRGYRLLLAGSTVSILGNQVASLAYPLLVLAVTGSPVGAGIVGFAGSLPSLVLYLPAGALVDRWDPRRTAIACEAGRGLAVATVVLALLDGSCTVPHLAVVAFLEGTFAVFTSVAEFRLLRAVLAPGQEPAALARNEVRSGLALLLGLPMGGLLFALAPVAPFAVDVGTFAVSVATLSLIAVPLAVPRGRPPGRPRPQEHRRAGRPRPDSPGRTAGAWRQDMLSGLRVVRRDRYLGPVIVLGAVATMLSKVLYLVFIASAHAQGSSSLSTGAGFMIAGVGCLCGSAVADRLFRRHGFRLALMVMWTWALAMVPVLVVLDAVTFGLAIGIFTLAGVTVNVVIGSYLLQRVPPQLLGRVTGVDKMLQYGASALAPLAGGTLFDSFGTRTSCLLVFASMTLVAAAATCTRSLRNPPDRPR